MSLLAIFQAPPQCSTHIITVSSNSNTQQCRQPVNALVSTSILRITPGSVTTHQAITNSSTQHSTYYSSPKLQHSSVIHSHMPIHHKAGKALHRKITHTTIVLGGGHNLYGSDGPTIFLHGACSKDGQAEPPASHSQASQHLKVVSNNAHHVTPEQAHLQASWDSHITGHLDTNLTALSISKVRAILAEEGNYIHRAEYRPQAQTSSGIDSPYSAEGGVAITADDVIRLTMPSDLDDESFRILSSTGRWIEQQAFSNEGTHVLSIAFFYGSPGPTLQQKESRGYKLNECLLNHAIQRMIKSPHAYLRMGDFNVDPINSEVITTATETEDTVDVIKERLGQDIEPPPTYRRKGPFEGMVGKGCTRLDVVLSKKVSYNIIDHATYCCELNFDDHVPIAVILQPSNLDNFTMQANTLARIPFEGTPKDNCSQEAHNTAHYQCHQCIWSLI